MTSFHFKSCRFDITRSFNTGSILLHPLPIIKHNLTLARRGNAAAEQPTQWIEKSRKRILVHRRLYSKFLRYDTNARRSVQKSKFSMLFARHASNSWICNSRYRDKCMVTVWNKWSSIACSTWKKKPKQTATRTPIASNWWRMNSNRVVAKKPWILRFFSTLWHSNTGHNSKLRFQWRIFSLWR